MQSLGKVPSARRPPANLPSLKAETLTPTDQSGSWGGAEGTQPQTQSTQVVGANTTSVTQSNQSVVNSAVSAATQNSVSLSQSSITSNSSNSISNTLASNNTATNQLNTSSSSSSSATWSSVATGAIVETVQPPLYQSPQFQHEFPSLDGSAPPPLKGNRDYSMQNHHGGGVNNTGGGTGENQQMSLRPHTDVSSWMIQQQHQQGGNGRGETADTQISQQVQVLQQGPPNLRALMPPFMTRGNNGATSGGQNIGPPNSSLPPSSSQQQLQSGGGSMNYQQIQVKQRQTSGAQTFNDDNNYSSPYGRRNDDNRMPSYQRRVIMQNRGSQNRSDNSSAHETEDLLIHRPIIKEEELERMDSIAKDDGWAKSDEIDYNQKLVFSDDECMDSNPKDTHQNNKNDKKSATAIRDLQMQQQQQQQRQEEDNRTSKYSNIFFNKNLKAKIFLFFTVWNRERENLEREKLERERNERNVALDKDNMNVNRLQQNGHRGLDADVVERVKQRKEEEEKKVLERKQAASKKLEELEQKMKKKNELDNMDGSSSDNNNINIINKTETSDFRAMTQSGNNNNNNNSKDSGRHTIRDSDRLKNDRDMKDIRDRDYLRYDKYDRDMNSRERDNSYKDSYGHGRDRDRLDSRDLRDSRDNAIQFSRQFQSNLPPRFQKQHQQDQRQPFSSGPSGSGGGGGNNNSSTSSYNSSNRNNIYLSEQKSVPFAQQYDPRYISHSHSSYKSSTQLRRNPSEEMMKQRQPLHENRKRIDSEEEDRFSSGRESISRNSIGDKTPQLARSISDSSQRKTSVSSEDKPLDSSFRSDRSESRELSGSWVDELEAENNAQKDESSQIKPETIPATNCEPKHILQRVHKYSESSNTDKEKSEEREIIKPDNTQTTDIKQESSDVLVIPEILKSWADCVHETGETTSINKVVEKQQTESDQILQQPPSTPTPIAVKSSITPTEEKKITLTSLNEKTLDVVPPSVTGNNNNKDDDKQSTRSYSSSGGPKDFSGKKTTIIYMLVKIC